MLIAAVSLCCALAVFGVVVLCFGRSAAKKDKIRGRLSELGRDLARSYLLMEEDLNKPLTERVIFPVLKKIAGWLSGLVPTRRRDNSRYEQQRRLLQQAGWTISVEEYTVLQMILTGSGGLAGILLALLARAELKNAVLYFGAGVLIAYTALRYTCAATGTRRCQAMEKQLPDMLDLLSVSVAAGLGFERAMLHIIETMDGPLIDEFAVAYREMSMGRSRKDAMTLLGERCGVEDLSSVTSAIVQAGQLGLPIRNVLQSQSAAIRRSRRSKVQEKAAKVSTKILLPMIAFIFPVLIIVLLGPSVITLMEQFL